MPVASSLDRLQPCLFERLTDFNPERRVESRSEQVISMSRYREAVIRDLQWVLNSSTHLKSEGLDEFPQVERSVFNFGKKDLAGMVVSGLNIVSLEAEVAKAIRLFEPRIVPETLKVKCVSNEGGKGGGGRKAIGGYNCLTFQIKGELWSHPVSEEFFLKTTLELDSGLQPV